MAVSTKNSLTVESKDPVNNSAVIRYIVEITTSGSSFNDYNQTGTFYINGTKYTATYKLPKSKTTTVFNKTVTIENADGKTIEASFSCPTTPANGTKSGSTSIKIDLDRELHSAYVDCNTRHSTSLYMYWKASHTISRLQYKIDNDDWIDISMDVNASSGYYTISGLKENTTYKISMDLKRRDTGIWATTSSVSPSVTVTTLVGTHPTIELSSKTSTSLTVLSNCNVACKDTKYRIKEDGTDNYSEYQTSNIFTNLKPNTGYTIEVYTVGQENGDSGTATVWAKTYEKIETDITLERKSSTEIVVNSISNVETIQVQYRIKENNKEYGAYQTSKLFSNLKPNTIYVVEVKAVSKESKESGYNTLSVQTFKSTQPTITLVNKTINSITVTSDCNVEVSETLYRIKKSLDTTYGPYQASSIFTNLDYNTYYDIEVSKTGSESNEIGIATLTRVCTLDIARIINCDTDWNVENDITFNIINSGNSAIRLYLSYNNVEIIYRNNINLVDGQYVLTLTESERNQLYYLAAGDNNQDFKFILKSYYNGVLVNSDTAKKVNIKFTTKAWVKIEEIWYRALVWGRETINDAWKQCLPWVDIDLDKNWKKI